MTEHPNRLREARKAADLTQVRLGELAGTTGATINKLETGQRKLTVEWAQKLAPHLHIQPLALFSDGIEQYHPNHDAAHFVAVRSIKIRGEIAAGVWMRGNGESIGANQEVSTVAGKWSEFAQVAFRHRGDGMAGARLYDGECVIIVDYAEARRGFADGDLVVIERQRGEFLERSCKRLAIGRTGGMAFRNEPANPDDAGFAEIVQCGDDMKEPDGTSVVVLGFVVSVTRFLA